MSPRYEVNSKAFGLLWYWNRIDIRGFPTEKVNNHGPYVLKFLAVRAAKKATNS